MSYLPVRETERLADLGVARMLAVLAGLHALAGGAVAAVLNQKDALVVGGGDGVSALVLLGAAALALRLGAGAREPGFGGGRRFDLALVTTALVVTGVADTLRMIATGATWVGLELPLALVIAAALPRLYAVASGCGVLATAGLGVLVVAGRGPRTSAELIGTLLPLVALPAAAGVALAWRRRVGLLTSRLLAAQEAARTDSVHDQLTGAVNRRGLDMVAAPMVENARRQGEAAHCLFVDVDGFREVNERHGAAAGDDVLRALAAALAVAVRTTDVVARWTGDEFVVVGPGTGTSPLELERRVHASLTEAPPLPPERWTARVSIGSATLVPWDEGDLASLLRRAEQDMRLRRSLRRQRADRNGPEISAPPQRPVAGNAEHQG